MSIELERLFRSAPHAYLVVSPDLRVLDVNACYLSTLGAQREALLGRPAIDAIARILRDPSSDLGDDLRRSFMRVLQSAQPDSLTQRRYELQGIQPTTRSLRLGNTPLLDDQGVLTSILHSVEDLTDCAHPSQQRYAELLDTAPDAIVVVDANGCIELVNEQTVQLFGYARGELLGARLECLLPEPLRERHRSHLQRYFAQPVPRPMASGLELVARRKDGSEFPIEVSLSPLQNQHGSSVSAAIRDISPRIRAEAESRLNAERFSSAMEAMQDAFAVFDASDRLVRCNAAYRRLFAPAELHPSLGMKRELLVEAWLKLLDPSSLPHADAWRSQRRSLELRTRDARSLRLTSQPTGQGDSVEVIWDLSAEEQRTAELRLARAEAEAASRAKSEFLSSMSHELRTPMNSILGFAQLLMRDTKEPLSSRHRERVGHILQSGEHLLRLIDDVLNLARIESGRVPIALESVSMHEVLAELVRTLGPMANERKVQLEAAQLESGFPRVLGDRARVLQILLNYGSNAIKYNRPHGRVTVSVLALKAAVRLQVADTGMGIPTEQQSKLFQAFQRAGQEAGPIEGTGIGLLITKKLAELMDGRVGFESTPGVGSLFWVELPLAAAETETDTETETGPTSSGPDARRASAPVLAHCVVLYVEDNPANIAFMCDLFEDIEGMKLVTARSATEGLLLTRALRPQVVLMDIDLPDMSGSEALRVLRQSPETAAIPVVALTAAASERERKAGLRAGFYRYLTKPLDVDELMSALESALGHASSVSHGVRPPFGVP